MIFWGAALALQVSVLRFVIIDLCPISHKGSAYGIFNGFFGFALLLGNTVMGILYSLSIAAIGYFVLAMEGFSLALLWLILRQHLGKPRERQT
jgi:predicted MFS family arabinose efflux permease